MERSGGLERAEALRGSGHHKDQLTCHTNVGTATNRLFAPLKGIQVQKSRRMDFSFPSNGSNISVQPFSRPSGPCHLA